MIGAAFSLAQFLTSTLWGALSDRIGRKPVLLFGLVGSTFTAVAFGFSQTFWFALAMRAASGFLNGNVGVGKTIMGEITDESNRAQAFNLFGLMWEIGSIIAPILGGLLAEPAKQYPSLFGDFQLFIDYPYALPCMVGALVSGVGAVAGFFFLEETLGRKASKDADEEEGSGLKLKNMDNEPPLWVETRCRSRWTQSNSGSPFIRQPFRDAKALRLLDHCLWHQLLCQHHL